MPYKHIAAHLRKTELACRLHFHQLSHGGNRRERTTSVTPGSPTGGHSPVLPAAIPSPIMETLSRSASLPEVYGSGDFDGVQLPAIRSGGGAGGSPGLPSILLKPIAIALPAASSPQRTRAYPTPGRERATPPQSQQQHAAASLALPAAPVPFTRPAETTSPAGRGCQPALRPDCSALPPPQPPPPSATPCHPVDMSRLLTIYAAHRSAIWTAIAADYGNGASPAVLEQAWRGSTTIPSGNGQSHSGA